MKTSLLHRLNEAPPFALSDGMTAVCLSRSLRAEAKHGIFLVEASGKKWVIKCYHHKRGQPQRLLDNLGNYLSGRSGISPQRRFRNEMQSLQLWRENGFEVFRQSDEHPPISIDAPHLVFEYVSGRTLKNYFLDLEIAKAEKLCAFKRFLPEWGRRHFLANKTKNRFLIQEHATFQHVYMPAEDRRFIFYDFEIIYTHRHSLPSLIGREIAGYVRSLPAEDLDDYLRILIREYPQPEFLYYPFYYFFRHPNPVIRFLNAADRRLPRNRRQQSKYNIALRIQDYLRKDQPKL
ncbi:MAG: hypothetical protein JSW26_08505 [Desulfobacterales bacterium]|nr:MAG: hypothetical protein JSW26_08505 [Desulfobacterales bacterium]